MKDGEPYDYRTVGYNAFFRRTFFSSPATNNLSGLGGSEGGGGGSRAINFDSRQISGSFGDSIKVGNITIDGRNGRISVSDDTGTELVRIGKIDE